MPLYRFAFRSVSRGRGELIITLAAYTAGERLYHEREDTIYNFSWRRRDLIHAELIGACGWTRERLWNHAEWAEGRWDGVTGREIIVALPAELSRREQIRLARKLARFLSRRYGVAVDLAVHRPSRGGDQRNVHAHLILSARVMTPEGLGERTHVWDRKYTGGPELRRARRAWARMQNRALEQSGVAERVDERSYKDQGVERLPGLHQGRVITELERQGIPTRVGDYNRSVSLLNRIRSAVGPELNWEWETMPDRFSDEHGAEAYRVCWRRMHEINRALAALEGDRQALSRDSRKEMVAERAELLALRKILRQCLRAVMEERLKLRRESRDLHRDRTRGRAA